MRNESHNEKVVVYYDGLCRVCAGEIELYKKMQGASEIIFVDITNPAFNASNEGLDPFLVHKELHSRDKQGNLFVGVDTFILIWETLPKLRWLTKLARTSAFNSFLKLNYKLFVKVRPYLPRKWSEPRFFGHGLKVHGLLILDRALHAKG